MRKDQRAEARRMAEAIDAAKKKNRVGSEYKKPVKHPAKRGHK